MTDADEPRSEPAPQKQTPPAPPSLEDFASLDFEKPIASIKFVECLELYMQFGEAGAVAAKAGDEAGHRAFTLLTNISSLHLRVNDRAAPYGPLMVLTNGSRSATTADFKSMIDVLDGIYLRVRNPGLRARIADVVWLNQKKRKSAADAAVDAYCEAVEGLVDGTYKDRYDSSAVPHSRVVLIERALQISSATNKRDNISERAKALTVSLYYAAKQTNSCGAFADISRLRLLYNFIDLEELAADAESVAIAAGTAEELYPLATKRAWDLAAHAFEQLKNNDEKRRCELQAVQQTLAMRRHVSGAAAEAHWIKTAIAELSQISGTQDRRENLRKEMRALQERSLDEIGSFSMPLNLEEMRVDIEHGFNMLSVSASLREFALLDRSRWPSDLRTEALKTVHDSPLMAMAGFINYDSEGKEIYESPGAPHEGAPSEEWFKAQIARNNSVHRHIVVGGCIDSARLSIGSRFLITESHFLPIVELSPFVPASHRLTFAVGFARLFQGDFVSAAHLLIPQLENSVRYVLGSKTDSSSIKSNMLQGDRSLSTLLEKFRKELEALFGEPIIYDIDLLFHYQGGPALRHAFAHGKVASGACFGTDVIYACWFIYRLSCIPLLDAWDTVVGPALEAVEQ